MKLFSLFAGFISNACSWKFKTLYIISVRTSALIYTMCDVLRAYMPLCSCVHITALFHPYPP